MLKTSIRKKVTRDFFERENLVTPTVYNFLSLEESLKKLVNENIDKPIEEAFM